MGVRRQQQQRQQQQQQMDLSTPNLSAMGAHAQNAVVNVVVVGEPGVGKTALIDRAVHDRFNAQSGGKRSNNNGSAKITEWNFVVAGRNVRYRITDITGPLCDLADAPFAVLRSSSDVFLLCYDISNPASLDAAARGWSHDLGSVAPNVPVVLVGCKSDKRRDPTCVDSVSSETALGASQRSGCQLYVETSAAADSSARSALSAFEVAGLVALGQLGNGGGVRQEMNIHRHHNQRFGGSLASRRPPPVPPKATKLFPPVPPKPRRAYSQLALNKDLSLASPSDRSQQHHQSSIKRVQMPVQHHQQQQQFQQQYQHPPLSPRMNLRSSRERSSVSTLSLTTGSSGGSSLRTPKSQRRNRNANKSEKDGKMIKIKCQRLTPDRRYEEVEVEVPENVYQTLKLYNDHDEKLAKTAMSQQQQFHSRSKQDLTKAKSESLAAKIRRLLFIKN